MAISENGVSNLWAQPIEGGLGHQITNFSSESIGYYQVSRDGKSLLLLRRQIESDIVLLRDILQTSKRARTSTPSCGPVESGHPHS